MTTATRSSDDLFRQAISAWESAVDSGVKMQEQSARWLREICGNSESLSDWYSRGQRMMSETIAKAQENIDEAMRAVNQQAESSVRLVQKAIETRHAENGSDVRQQFAEWWEAAMESMRMNTQAMLKANSRILTTCSELARRINDDAADAMANLARRTADQAEKVATSATEHFQETMRQAGQQAERATEEATRAAEQGGQSQ